MATLETIEEGLKNFKDNIIDRLDRSDERTDQHFKELNGKVARNTGFRFMAMGGFAVLSFMGVGTLIGLYANIIEPSKIQLSNDQIESIRQAITDDVQNDLQSKLNKGEIQLEVVTE